MSDRKTRRRPCRNTVLARDAKSAKELCNTYAPLITPSLNGIPQIIVPEILKMSSPKVLQGLAKILLYLCPDTEHKWGKGAKTSQIAETIITWLVEALQHKAGPSVEVDIGLRQRENSNIGDIGFGKHSHIIDTRACFMFHEGPYTIFYEETVKAVNTNSPRAVPLVKDAVRLLGRFAYSSDDVRQQAEDWFETMSEDIEDKEEVVTYKSNLRAIKKCGKKGFFHFTKEANDKMLNRLKNRAKVFEPSNDVEEHVANWVNDIIKLVSNKHFLNEDEDSEYRNGGYLTYEMLFPVFYSFNEHDLLDFYDETINGDYGSGALPEVPLSFSLDLSSENSQQERFDTFTKDLEYLSLYERVFREAPNANWQ